MARPRAKGSTVRSYAIRRRELHAAFPRYSTTKALAEARALITLNVEPKKRYAALTLPLGRDG